MLSGKKCHLVFRLVYASFDILKYRKRFKIFVFP